MDITEVSMALREVDDTFNRVNWGGCACIAAMVAEKVQANNYPLRITTCGNSSVDIDEIRADVDNPLEKENWYPHGINAFHHVWVEVQVNGEWWAMDSTGIHSLDAMYEEWGTPCTGSFTLEEMKSMAAQNTWNSSFDRRQLPHIEEMISSIEF